MYNNGKLEDTYMHYLVHDYISINITLNENLILRKCAKNVFLFFDQYMLENKKLMCKN